MKPTPENWRQSAFFGIHYDLHAGAGDTALGSELTPEHLRERLERIRPDWIQCDCKGHPGYASWPTDVGSTSPGVVRDSLRIHRDVAAALGIPLGVHYSGVLDRRAIELHPDWAVVNPDGTRRDDAACRLSPYADQLMIPQLLEVIDKYDVDGFWVDGENWACSPCWCPRCRAEFRARTGIENAPESPEQPHWSQWLAFHRDLFCEYVARYTRAVHARKPGCLVCSNWMYTIRQPEPITAPVDYLSGDYTPNWGAARAALEGRMLDARGMSWDLMAWGFTRNYQVPGSPWAMKPAVHLKQEVAEVLALGGAVMIYAKPHRSGWLTGWEHEIIAETAEFCRARKTACFGSKSRSQAAVLHHPPHYYAHNQPLFNYGRAVEPLEGALNLLLESHRSADILTTEMLPERLSTLRLLVIPEQTGLGPETTAMLQPWIESGGTALLSGAHLARELPEFVGCRPDGPPLDVPWDLPVGSEAAAVSGPWQPVQPEPEVEVWTRSVHNLEPARPEPGGGRPAVTCRRLGKGRILAVHGPVFQNYFALHFPRIRRMVAQWIERLNLEWNVEMTGPAWAEMIVREKDGNLMIHLINRGSGETLAPNRTIIEELPPLTGIELDVRLPAPPRRVQLLPGPEDLPAHWARGILHIRVPMVPIHRIVAVTPGE